MSIFGSSYFGELLFWGLYLGPLFGETTNWRGLVVISYYSACSQDAICVAPRLDRTGHFVVHHTLLERVREAQEVVA